LWRCSPFESCILPSTNNIFGRELPTRGAIVVGFAIFATCHFLHVVEIIFMSSQRKITTPLLVSPGNATLSLPWIFSKVAGYFDNLVLLFSKGQR
jgi:hypothetical protein